MATSKASYAQQLWDRLEPVLKQSQDRRRDLEEFIGAIQRRVQAEDTYAKSIDSIGKIMDKFSQEKSCIALTYAAFKADHAHRAHQSRVLAQELRDQVLNMLRQMQTNQANESKKLEKDARKLQKQMQSLTESLNEARVTYVESEKKRQEQQILNEIAKVSSELTTQKKQKQNSYTKDIEKETKEYEQVYRLATKEFNDYLEQYMSEMSKILSKYQEHEQQRIEKQVDTIMKMLVFETSMMRNFDYDIANISKQMEGIKAESDIELFINQNKSTSNKPSAETPYNNVTYLNNSIIKVNSKALEARVELFQVTEGVTQNNEWTKKLVDSIVKGEETPKDVNLLPSEILELQKMQNLILACWKVRPVTQEERVSLRTLAENEKYRHYFAMIFKSQSSQSGPQLTFQGFDNASILVDVVLERCLATKDTYVIRRLLSLMFTLWTYVNKPVENGSSTVKPEERQTQRFLFVKLYNNQVWRLPDLWQAIIFESAQEALKGSIGEKGETLQSAIVRQKSVIVGQFALYCHYMLMLGNHPKIVREVIGKYCRHYKVSEEQSKVLSDTINETAKNFKETFGVQSKAKSQESKDSK